MAGSRQVTQLPLFWAQVCGSRWDSEMPGASQYTTPVVSDSVVERADDHSKVEQIAVHPRLCRGTEFFTIRTCTLEPKGGPRCRIQGKRFAFSANRAYTEPISSKIQRYCLSNSLR